MYGVCIVACLVIHQPPSQLLHRDEAEVWRMEKLSLTRHSIAQCRTHLPTFLKLAEVFSEDESGSRYREIVINIRFKMAELQAEERRLWEAQPGGIVAPLPRPVVRK